MTIRIVQIVIFRIMNTITIVDLLNISIHGTKIKHQVLSNIIVLGCFYCFSKFMWVKIARF